MMRIDSMIVLFWFVPVVLQIVLPLAMLLGFGVRRMFAGKVGK